MKQQEDNFTSKIFDIPDADINKAYANYSNLDKASALISHAAASEDTLRILEELLDFCDKMAGDIVLFHGATLNTKAILNKAEHASKIQIYAYIERGIIKCDF